jgi:3-oxoadipate enol-lactonase
MKLTHRNIETHYLDSGGDGRPFLLVHGFTGSLIDFYDEFDGLADNRRTIVLDQRGHGESTNSGNLDEYCLQVLVDDLISFIETLKLPPVDILGHSLGGMVVMRAVLKRPELFYSMLLMDTAAQSLEMGAKMSDRVVKAIKDDGVQVLVDYVYQPNPSVEVRNGIDRLGETEHLRRIRTKLMQMDPQAFFGLRDELGAQQGVLTELSQVIVPTTIIVGSADTPFREPSEKMAAKIAGSNLIVVPDAAHSPQYENRDAWYEALQKHFESLES